MRYLGFAGGVAGPCAKAFYNRFRSSRNASVRSRRNNVCPFANYDTAELARRIEAAVFPNDLHFYEEKCIGCGVCVIKCPMRALTRSEKKYCKLTLMGRTGKRNPRLGEGFLVWADADNIIKIILNTYKFVEKYISPDAPARKEHIGYIIDRVGFEEYKKWALDGVELAPETIVKQCVYWSGIHFDR